VNVVLSRGNLVDTLVDLAGFKAGVLVTPEMIGKLLPDCNSLLRGDASVLLRFRAEELQLMAHSLLTALGATASPEPASPIDLLLKYQGDKARLDVERGVGDIMFDLVREQFLREGPGPIDLTSLKPTTISRFGEMGAQVADDWVDLTTRAVMEFPWNRFRYVDWKNEIELKDLFENTSLGTAYGTFFDQRFINYLHQNFDSIDQINWRKFEGLTAEYFAREGAHVELGPGSNDDGVDARVWWPGDDPRLPAAILIQCKRLRTKVGRTVLKALYADILHEDARSGLIVTTQTLSPGAEQTRTARCYPIETADRGRLRKWVASMRSVYGGRAEEPTAQE
jgi:restriction system protein